MSMILVSVSIPFLNKGFFFATLNFEKKVLSVMGKFVMLARWIVVTRAPSLRNLAEIWSILEDLTASKFFKVLSTVVTS